MESNQGTLGEESAEYISESTIDNEPKPEREAKPKKQAKEGEQASLFDEEELDGKHREYLATNTPGQVAYKCTLVIDGGHFKNTIVFGGEKIPSESFSEYLMQSINGAYLQQQIRGICGEQIPTAKQETLPLADNTEKVCEGTGEEMIPVRGDSNAEVAPVSASTGYEEVSHVDTVDHEAVLRGEAA